MEDNINTTEVNEAEKAIREAAEQMAEQVRNQALIRGAQMICVNVVNIMDKHIGKAGKTSMNDYKRCFKEIYEFVSVPLKKLETQQNDSEGEIADDGATEELG
jgi:uncharacterized protein YutE (UPF0331/DUF86 family)